MKKTIVIILVLALGLGLGYYLGFDQGWEGSVRQSSPVPTNETPGVPQVEPSPQTTLTPFQESDRYGFFGTLTLTGYTNIQTRVCNPGDMCGETVEYVNFHFNPEPNPALKEFLGQNQGNSFAGAAIIGMGCYQQDRQRIFYENFGDESNVQGTITGPDLEKLLASSNDNQVRLQLTRPIYTSGQGAPDCYSHFRNFDVL